MILKNGDLSTHTDDDSSTLSVNSTASTNTNGMPHTVQTQPRQARTAGNGHATPGTIYIPRQRLQESASSSPLLASTAYDRRPQHSLQDSSSPPAPLNFSAYSLAMLRHTQMQLDATPESPRSPSHTRVSRPVSYSRRRIQPDYQQLQLQLQQQRLQHRQYLRHHRGHSPHASPQDRTTTVLPNNVSRSASDTA